MYKRSRLSEPREHHLYARIPERLFQQLASLAEAHCRSVTAEVNIALEAYVAAYQQSPPPRLNLEP